MSLSERRAAPSRLIAVLSRAPRRLSTAAATLAALVLMGAALPAAAAADTEPSAAVTTWSTVASDGLLSTISAAPAGSPGSQYLHTTYTSLAGSGLLSGLLGLDATETVTSPSFTFTGPTPQAITLTLQQRASLGALVGVNGGVSITTSLVNTATNASTQLQSSDITTSSTAFQTVTASVPAATLVNNQSYKLVVVEHVAPLLQVAGSATIDLQDVALDITPTAAPSLGSGAPTVSGVTSSGADVNDTVDPGADTTTVSVDYGTTTAYGSTVSQTVPANAGPTAVTLPISGLSPSTPYHAQVVATSAAGTVTSSDFTFMTAATPPSATPPAIGSPSLDGSPGERTATIGGTVDTGGQGGTYYVQYGTSTAYGMTTSPQTLAAGTTGAVPVSVDVSGLSPNTAYHAQLVATDPGGTTTSSDISFTTAPATPPTVTMAQVARADTPSGSSGDSVDVGASVNPGQGDTQVSVAYGTTTSYGTTTPTQTLSAGSGTSSPQFVISGLSPGTSYHFQLTATNADGTVSSMDLPYTTPAANANPTPTVGATSVTASTETSATLESSIDTGGAATASYVLRWGTSPTNLTQSTATQSLAASSSDTQTLTGQLSGLAPGTTYYAQFVATVGGTAYDGDVVSFTTDPAPTPPTIDTSSTSNVQSTTATVEAMVDPGSETATVYADYGTTSAYGSQTPAVTVPAGSGPTLVTLPLTGLSAGSEYYVRIVVTDAGQTPVQHDLTFSTTSPTGGGSGTTSGGTSTGTTTSGTGTAPITAGPACVAAYVSAPARAMSLLRLPAGAEVTAHAGLRIAIARRTKLRGHASYRLAGGATRATTRRGFTLGLHQLALNRTLHLSVTLPTSRTHHVRLRLAISTLPCGANLIATRTSRSRVAVAVRTAVPARRLTLTVPAGWSAPRGLRLTGPTGTRTHAVTATHGALRITGGGRVRIHRSRTRITISGLSRQTTGVTLLFAARSAHGTVLVRVLRVHGGTRTVRVTVGA